MDDSTAVLDELRSIRRLLSSAAAGALNREAAANYLSISTATLDRLTGEGRPLQSVCVSQGRVAWRRVDLDAYLADLVS
jgi:hypothetical protein